MCLLCRLFQWLSVFQPIYLTAIIYYIGPSGVIRDQAQVTTLEAGTPMRFVSSPCVPGGKSVGSLIERCSLTSALCTAVHVRRLRRAADYVRICAIAS